MIDRLAYYERIGEVAGQIRYIQECVEKKKVVRVINIPSGYDPQDLIVLLVERIRILEVAVNCSEKQIHEWLSEAKKRLTGEKEKDRRTLDEIETLKIGIC